MLNIIIGNFLNQSTKAFVNSRSLMVTFFN